MSYYEFLLVRLGYDLGNNLSKVKYKGLQIINMSLDLFASNYVLDGMYWLLSSYHLVRSFMLGK